MKRLILGSFGGCIIGGALGVAVGIFIYPFLFLSDVVAVETLDATKADTRVVLASGQFTQANPNDPVHWGKGEVSLIEEDGKVVVFIGADFEVGPGPAYRVYVKEAADITSRKEFQNSEGANLGTLRAFKGSQVYPLPEEIDPSKILSIVIWCESFRVLISPATLTPTDGA